MRKLLLTSLLLAGACTSHTTEVPVPAPTPAPVATAPVAIGPRPAVELFLAAVAAQDLQALSDAWGDKDGPVRTSKVLSREEMEQREIILMHCFKHDRFRILGESPAMNNERVFQVELTRGTLTRVTDFYTAKAADRWYVRTADIEKVRDLCPSR